MGEVYRAVDTNLKRQVAIKVLPADVAAEPDRLARLQREAEMLAALNHPHIAQIYGLERTGATTALVMELVEGPTLADRIAQGPMAVEDALPIARQIAEALEAAHEQGIVHRDLKPANIKVRDDGTVKVLDFGLAKAIQPAAAPASNPTLSPTITTPAVTRAGIVLGTAAYMSPEQAKGRAADKRSDVWAFGCVLYEMLTARRAFDGEDMTEVLGAVVRLEPDWQALPPDVPPAIRTLLHRCLIKDRRARIGDIAAARFVLEHQAGFAAAGTAPAATPRRSWWRGAAIAAGAFAIALLSGGLGWWVSRPPPPTVTQLTITADPPLSLSGTWRDIAITPDGTRVVWVSGNTIVVRSLVTREPPRVLDGLGVPRSIFLSPDGRWIGFFDGQTIKKVPITGGRARGREPRPGRRCRRQLGAG